MPGKTPCISVFESKLFAFGLCLTDRVSVLCPLLVALLIGQ